MKLQQLLGLLPWNRSAARQLRDMELADRTVSTPPQSRHPAPVRLDRLDLQTAIIHHLEWCVLFNEHLSVNSEQALQLAPLPDARHSMLGRWLTQVGQRSPGAHPSFAGLQQEHLRFHSLARQALDLAHNDRMDLASTLLNNDFERSRARILELLRSMQKG
jgi:hypothetical protein